MQCSSSLWAMSQNLPAFNFQWVEDTSQFNKVFIKNYDEKSEVGYILEVDVQYPEKSYKLHSDLPFLPEKKKLVKVEKLVTSLQDKCEYVVHIKGLKQALNHGLILKKVHGVISFNHNECLKSNIEMNIELRTEEINDFEKDLSKLMNNAVFNKTMKTVRKHTDIKLVTIEIITNYFVPESNYHKTIFFTGNLLAIEMKKTQITMNKPVYLGLSILDISKFKMYEFWYDYLIPKYNEKATLCYMDTDNLIVQVKTEDIYKDISEDVEKKFHTSNYEVDKQLPIGKNKKAAALMKDELGG